MSSSNKFLNLNDSVLNLLTGIESNTGFLITTGINVDTGITSIIANAGLDLNTSLLSLESGGNLSSINTSNSLILVDTSSIDINTNLSNTNETTMINSLLNLEDLSLGVSKNTNDTFNVLDSGIVDVNILSSLPSTIGNLVDVRAARINLFRMQEMNMATDGLSSTDTATSLGDDLDTGDLLTIPTGQIASSASFIGGTAAAGNDGDVIEIQYYATDSATSITTVNVTLLTGHEDGQALTFAWFRIVQLKYVSGGTLGVIFVGDDSFVSGKPTVTIYKNMNNEIGVSRNGNTYFNPDEKMYLTLMTISNGFNAAGAVYRLDTTLRQDAASLVQNILIQTYMRQGPTTLDYSNIDGKTGSTVRGFDLIYTIQRTNSTHNAEVVINFGAVVEDIS